MSVLLVAFGALAAIWILVLLGSPFFGPRDPLDPDPTSHRDSAVKIEPAALA